MTDAAGSPRIRSALPAEAEALSSLALRSKAHWGDTPGELAVFAGELTLAPAARARVRPELPEDRVAMVEYADAFGAV